MPSSHALLSPSSAHRWMVCTPSAMLESTFPPSTSVYAEEGTKAHSLCEKMLRQSDSARIERPDDVDPEMWGAAVFYAEAVEEELAEAKTHTKDARLFVEQKLDLSNWVPDAFGTSDAVIVSDQTLVVIDFKYGKGVRVDAVDNPQLRLYALGAYEELSGIYEFTDIKTIIIQPRMDNISSETFSVSELLMWAEAFVRPAAAKAMNGEGEFVPGEHCRFCRAGATCRARVEEAFDVLDHADTEPPLIDDDEIPGILDKLDNCEKWIDAIRAYAQDMAVKGHKWPGYKLVEGRTNRKVTDPIEAAKRLERADFEEDEYTTTKLKGITDLEKLCGKKLFAELLGDIVVKPKGEPTLVKESDKRPEINPIEQAFKEEI